MAQGSPRPGSSTAKAWVIVIVRVANVLGGLLMMAREVIRAGAEADVSPDPTC